MFCGTCNIRELKKMKKGPRGKKNREGSVMEVDIKSQVY